MTDQTVGLGKRQKKVSGYDPRKPDRARSIVDPRQTLRVNKGSEKIWPPDHTALDWSAVGPKEEYSRPKLGKSKSNGMDPSRG